MLAEPPEPNPTLHAHRPATMKAQQLLQAINPELRQQIIAYVQTDERPAYRALIQNLAQQRRLRPQFVLEKSRPKQAEWLLAQLYLKTNDPVAEQLLQIWLLKARRPMLVTFLDAVGITHDDKGQVEDLPDEIPEDNAAAGIQALLAAHPAAEAALYLHMFQLQRPGGWDGLAKALAACTEVQLPSAS